MSLTREKAEGIRENVLLTGENGLGSAFPFFFSLDGPGFSSACQISRPALRKSGPGDQAGVPRFEENIKYSNPVAARAQPAPVKNAAGGETRVQMNPNSRLAASAPRPIAAL